MNVEFTKDRETKNAVRYAEILNEGMERGHVGTIYVLKETLKTKFGEIPNRLTIAIP